VSQLTAPKGTFDTLPPDSERFLAVREALTAPLRRAGYGYVETPVFEHTEVFARGVGESTDVVTKEMYTFDDRGGRSLTLRPELTAGLMRAFIEHRLHTGALPVKLWTARPSGTSGRRPAATGTSRRSTWKRSASTTRRWTPRSSRWACRASAASG
jgi:histidyl-tRNA synthetase